MSKIFLLFIFILLPLPALAICEGPIVPCGREGTPPCTLCHIFALIDNVLRFIFTCLTPIAAVLMIVAGGFLLLVSGASPSLMNQAKSMLIAVGVGLLLILSSWLILNTFLTTIGLADWVGIQNGGFEIVCGYPEPPPLPNGNNAANNNAVASPYCGDCLEKAPGDPTCNSPVAIDTNWGELALDPDYAFACGGDNERCDSGTCRICEFGYGDTLNSAGGYLSNDGCNGCVGQGGKACWYIGYYEYYDQTSCNHICQDHGAQCVQANWNDLGCNAGKNLVPLAFTWDAPINTPDSYYRCVDGYPYDSPYVSWSCIDDENAYCKGWGYISPGSPLYFGPTDCWSANQCACSERDPAVPQNCATQSYWTWSPSTMRKRICVCDF